MKELDLKLLECREYLKNRCTCYKSEVYDPVRRKFVILTPEEFVRQLFIAFLINKAKIPRSRIAVERKVIVNKIERRFDILVFDKSSKPILIVECKEHKVNLDQEVVDQAGMYNISIKAPYLIVTNGPITKGFKINFKKKNFVPLDFFPKI